MNRYFLDIEYEGLKTEDQHGTVLADTMAASRELLAAVIETAKGAFRGVENAVINGAVRDQGGVVFFECRIEIRSNWLSSGEAAS